MLYLGDLPFLAKGIHVDLFFFDLGRQGTARCNGSKASYEPNKKQSF